MAGRVLSVSISSSFGKVEVHVAHIPCGSSPPGYIKFETLHGINKMLSQNVRHHRLLCGDFNAPQYERQDGRIVTWVQYERDGKIITRDEWVDSAERNIVEDLWRYDLADVFRAQKNHNYEEYSHIVRAHKQRFHRRFDHVFASSSLNAIKTKYLHTYREGNLSDHSPIQVDFSPREI